MVIVCVTAQHCQMLDQVLSTFRVVPDYDLNIMKDRQNLFDITINILGGIKEVLEKERPDVVLVHGDTSTTFVTELACFYLQIPVGHVEAGLRTYNIFSPFPEEFNQAVSIVSQYNFAPTPLAQSNLLKERKKTETIYVTWNTVIDVMQHTVRNDYTHPELEWVGEARQYVMQQTRNLVAVKEFISLSRLKYLTATILRPDPFFALQILAEFRKNALPMAFRFL